MIKIEKCIKNRTCLTNLLNFTNLFLKKNCNALLTYQFSNFINKFCL